MNKIVFYSWQSDLPNFSNRGFIQQALENAATSITANDTIDIEPVIDRDTKGVSGSPDIAATIFGKISAADVFVADVSIVCRQEGSRATPNPNVLIELGYAMKALGHEKIILLFNQGFGKLEELPFDLRTRRLTLYNVSSETKDKSAERNNLQKKLDEAICAAIEGDSNRLSNDGALDSVLSAIENVQANRVIKIRRTLNEIFDKIKGFEPKLFREGGTAEDLLLAIDKTQELVADFSKIVEITATMDDESCSQEIIKWLGNILEKYDLPYGFAGTSSNADFDYYKFVGHELVTTFIAFLLRENKWNLIKIVLHDPIMVKYHRTKGGPVNLDIKHFSAFLPSLEDESRKTRRVSVHADKLNHRHTEGGLSHILPMEEFMSADFFMYLYSKLNALASDQWDYSWYPRSVVFMKNTPFYIINASQVRMAEKMADALGVKNVDDLKVGLKNVIPETSKLLPNTFWSCPISQEQIDNIGTR